MERISCNARIKPDEQSVPRQSATHIHFNVRFTLADDRELVRSSTTEILNSKDRTLVDPIKTYPRTRPLAGNRRDLRLPVSFFLREWRSALR